MEQLAFTPLLVMAIFFFHFMADFVLQSAWMANNKSKSLWPLSVHIAVYTLVMLFPFGWKFALINGACHFVVDFITSKVSSRFWAAKKIRPFFITVGLDQCVHAMCLVGTAHLAMFPKLMC